MRKWQDSKLIGLLLAVLLIFGIAACGDDDDDSASPGGTGDETPALKVGLAYDIGGRGDKSFNDAAAAGLDRVQEELELEIKELSAAVGETDADKESRLRLLAEEGYDPIIAVGFAYATALKAMAGDFPDTRFGIIDDASFEAPNVRSLVFAEEQGSYLVGAAAALKSTTNNIGFVGGVQVPLIGKFEAGYIAGAKKIKPDITVQVKYLTQPPDFTGFNDPAKGREAADGMFDQGADVVYHASGGSGGGVFESAEAKGHKAIGVDSDQYESAPAAVRDVIMTSMLKRVDVAVFTFVDDVGKGDFEAGTERFDLAVDGVGYSTSGGMVDDIEDQLDDLKQQIIDGDITVPTEP